MNIGTQGKRIAVKESCYVYIAVSLKNNAIASNSTLKCAFRGGMPLFLQYPFQPLAVNLTYCTFKVCLTC